MKFYIFPRYRNGIDTAPETARKTDKVFIQHAELTDNIEGGIPFETEQDLLLTDATVEGIADTVAMAEEIIAAALEDLGGVV